MAYTTLPVLDAVKAGTEIDGLEVGANTQGGNGFEFANDGKTILKVIEGTGVAEGITFEAILDRFGRAEDVLTRVVTASKSFIYGPFMPEIWNINGKLRFKFTGAAGAATTCMAIRVSHPT